MALFLLLAGIAGFVAVLAAVWLVCVYPYSSTSLKPAVWSFVGGALAALVTVFVACYLFWRSWPGD